MNTGGETPAALDARADDCAAMPADPWPGSCAGIFAHG